MNTKDATMIALKSAFTISVIMFIGLFPASAASGPRLQAGVAKVNITNIGSGRLVNDSLYVKALVLSGTKTAVIISLDAIAIDGIGSVGIDYLSNVRMQIQEELNIEAANILINTTHVHGAGYLVCADVETRTIQAVKKAWQNMVPVNIGVGTGYEDRIMENRRLKLKNGKEWTIRHANPLPPEKEVVGIGPVDPEIGILRLDRKNGKTLAVVFNFACHPYHGVPGKTMTADFPGFASKVIEDNLGDGATAIFIQGFSGDISTVLYKDVNSPRDAEMLGNMLGISTLKALNEIPAGKGGDLNVITEIIKLPRRTDLPERIDSLKAEEVRLLQSLRATSLNLKTFIPLYIKYNLSDEYPSYYSHRYLHDEMMGRNDLENLDTENRRNIDKYLRNIYAMERLARIQENMYFLEKFNELNMAAGEETIDVEIQAMRIGNFVLITFPAEVSVQVGLNIKKISPHEFTFAAGYTNGYIHYAPTAEQFEGEAYEDTNCLLAPEWQEIYEKKVSEMLKKL
jgi:hypothetical protein